MEGLQLGWTSPRVLLALAIGVAATAGVLGCETRAAELMIPLGLIRAGSFSAAVVATFLMAAAIYSAAFLISQLFHFALGESPLAIGVRFLSWTATPASPWLFPGQLGLSPDTAMRHAVLGGADWSAYAARRRAHTPDDKTS